MAIFELYGDGKQPRVFPRQVAFACSICIVMLGSLLYGYVNRAFYFEHPVTYKPVVVGLWYINSDVAEFIKQRGWSRQKALEFKQIHEFWSEESIGATYVAMFALWLSVWIGYVATVGCFIARRYSGRSAPGHGQ